MIKTIVKWSGTILVSTLTAVSSVSMFIGALQNDITTLKANAHTNTSREFERDTRILNSIGDLKKSLGEDIGSLKTEVRLLKEEVKKELR